MSVNVFTYVLLRSTGGNFKLLDNLTITGSLEMYRSLCHQQDGLKKLQHSISDDLFLYIGSASDYNLKKKLIDIRRRVFNNKKISSDFSDLNILTHDSKTLLNQYIVSLDNIAQNETELHEKFEEETHKIRESFKDAVSNRLFLNGLVLASHDLLTAVEKYIASPAPSGNKTDNTELGLMKYFSRFVTKSSPFSTFTQVSFIKLNSSVTPYTGIDTSKRIYSHVRLNNYILKFITALLLKYRPFYSNLFLKLNCTVTITDDSIKYLFNRNNSEAFQKIEKTSILDLVITEFTKSERVRFSELLNLLIESVDASAEDLEHMILEILSYGMIEFDLNINAKDIDWLSKLILQIESANLNDDNLKEFKNSLKHVKSLTEQYADADEYALKRNIVSSIHQILLDSYLEMHTACALPESERALMKTLYQKKSHVKNANKKNGDSDQPDTPTKADELKIDKLKQNNHPFFFLPTEKILYEDTSLLHPIRTDVDAMSKACTLLSKMYAKLPALTYSTHQKLRYELFFKSNYGEQREISLLSFYEDYYNKDLTKNLDDLIIKNEGLVALEEDANTWYSNVHKLLHARFTPGNSVIHIGNSEFESVRRLSKLSIPKDTLASSYCAFVQPCAVDGQITHESLFVLNAGVTQGHGKFFSRFISYGEPQVLTSIIEDNTPESIDVLYAEINDSSFFNANMHPPIMAYEIQSPGGHSSLLPHQQIALKDLVILYDQKQKELLVRDSSKNKRVVFFDLEFQEHTSRSPLYKLLANFSLSRPRMLYSLISCMPTHTYDTEYGTVIFTPRLVFEDQLVAARMRWKIGCNTLPKTGNNHNENYWTIRKWQRSLEIPDEIFISTTEIEKPEEKLTVNYKPQYINFNNPILTNLFIKNYCNRSSSFEIIFTEFLPGSNNLLDVHGERCVTEWLIQWSEKDS